MRHDAHYVEELSRPANRSVGKVIPINLVEPNPEQPRVEIGDLTELTSSIKQKGVLEPLLVKPNSNGTWMIIAGERRWRAANLAGLREVPCIELDIDEKSIAEIALIENLQRKDLTIWEEADGLAALNAKFGYTHEEIAKKIGKSRTTVTESMAIAGLPDDIREKCRELNISAKSILLEIARQFDEKAMFDFLQKIQDQSLNREDIRQVARPNKSTDKNQSSRQERISGKTKTISAGRNSALNNTNNIDTDISDISDSVDSNIFEFSSPSGAFDLRLTFNSANQYDKNSVLKALKETFEKIKADGVN
jgi:ParB family chromosome partitioning protein